MTITAIAIAIVVMNLVGMLHLSDGVMVVVIIVGVVGFVAGGISDMGKDERARQNRRDYWLKRGSGPYDQRTSRGQRYGKRSKW